MSRVCALSPALLAHGAVALLCIALLVLAGQPLITDDMWFHLALGKAFATGGPWLAHDPHLFTAAGPPSTSSWLADLTLYHIACLIGISGLRILHVLLVIAILLLAWRVLWRAARSPLLASAGLSVFIVLSTYRIAQLRPHLITIIATLSLYLLLFENPQKLSALRISLAVGLCAAWANFHGAFLLAPIFIGGASLAVFMAGRFQSPGDRIRSFERASALGLAFALVLVATALNPSGVHAHLAYSSAGADTLELSAVVRRVSRPGPCAGRSC